MSKRWSYKVVEVKPNIWGWGTRSLNKDAVQETLTRQGLQGWELVSMIQASAFSSATLVFKKEN